MSDTGKVAVITGSATGIGAAIARRLAGAGWRVTVTYTRSKAEAESTAAACEALGVEVLLARADVSRDADCRDLIAKTLERWGRIDGLVNNAGVTKFVAADDLEGLDAVDFEQIFSVNLGGAWQMTRAAAPALKASGHGAVVNISSHSGFSGSGSSLAYAASKGALNTLTLGLARTLAPAIRVNAVCPGYVETRWARKALDDAEFDKLKESIRQISPLKRVVQAEDVAEAVGWFLTGGASITGQLLVIDGGTHLAVGEPLR
jgi:3-oxoacyl-[acyl-carrier protein] reductase